MTKGAARRGSSTPAASRAAPARAARASRPRSRAGADPAWTAALVLVALVLRLVGIQAGLPEVYEEAYPFKKAWDMWGFASGGRFDPDPHWYRYPSLVLYLQWLGQAALYLGMLATGAARTLLDFRVQHEIDPTPFYLTGRGIIAVLGAATVVPVMALLRRAGAGAAAARIGGLLVAVSPALIAKSQVIEVDVPLALAVAWALLAAVVLSEGVTTRRVVLAGLATGLAASCKYPGVLLAVPCLLGLLLGARARAASARRAAPGLPAALATYGVTAILAMFVTSPFVFLNAGAAWADLSVEGEHMRTGHFGSDLGATWFAYLRAWSGEMAGIPLALASAAGLIVFSFARRPWALILGGFMVAYAALVSSFAMKADRYLLPLLPAAIVLACAAIDGLALRVAARANGRVSRNAGVLGLGAVLALPLLAGLPRHLATLRPDTRTVARAWIEANLPAGAFLGVESYGPPLMSPIGMQAIPRDLVAALRARGWAPPVYALQNVPMFQVDPARSAVFYDPALWRIADAFVVTGAVRDRYRREPGRFAAQCAFYDTLDRAWTRAAAFPANGGRGAEIVVYRNPAQSQPFALRRPLPGPRPELRPGPIIGGEGYFLHNLGLNYETFGFRGEALACHAASAGFIATEPGPAAAAAERGARLLAAAGQTADGVRLLEETAARVPGTALAQRLRALARGLPMLAR